MWYLALLCALTVGAHEGSPKGHLVIVGGGAMDRTFCKHVLQVAGGPECRVVVITLAAGPPDAESNHYRIWGRIGAQHVDLLDPADPREALDLIRHADLIWFGGGSQTKLTQSLDGTDLLDAIRDRYWDGATIAGTSAGAAVMSDVMIAGNSRRPDISAVPVIDKGFGFWPDVIVDQHFVRRHRFNRLKEAVLEHPTLVGVGIDESTGVVVTGRQFEVIGDSDVIIIDARRVSSRDSSRPQVSTQVLRAGMRYDLDKGLMDDYSDAVAAATDG